MLISEIFPTKVKGIAISVVGFFNSLVSFSVTQVFPWELSNLGPTATFAIYALLSFCAIFFVYKFVIETKGKTLEEVQEVLVASIKTEVSCGTCCVVMKRLFSGQVGVIFNGFGFPTNDAKVFKAPPNAKNKLREAGFKDEK